MFGRLFFNRKVYKDLGTKLSMENKDIKTLADLDPFKMNVESLKLSKMSKGYNWEIKIFPKDMDGIDIDKEMIDRITKLDEEMRERFGDNGTD